MEAKRLGRPPGVKNRAKPAPPQRIDPEQLIEAQLQLLSDVQGALAEDFKRTREAGQKWVDGKFIMSLGRHSQAIAKAVETLKRSTDVAEEMAKRMTAEQLLDAALRKIEASDTATVNYAIRRLRAQRDATATAQVAPIISAAEAIDRLEDSDDDDRGSDG